MLLQCIITSTTKPLISITVFVNGDFKTAYLKKRGVVYVLSNVLVVKNRLTKQIKRSNIRLKRKILVNAEW